MSDDKCEKCRRTKIDRHKIARIRQLKPLPAIDSAMYRHGFDDAIEAVTEILEGQ
jgi:hypothetical protein